VVGAQELAAVTQGTLDLGVDPMPREAGDLRQEAREERLERARGLPLFIYGSGQV